MTLVVLVGVEGHLTVGLTCVSLMANDVGHLYVLISHSCIFFGGISSQSSSLEECLPLSWKSFSYIPDTSYRICDLLIFLPSHGLFYTFQHKCF